MNNIESIFKEKSKSLQVKPSDDAWFRLESKLSVSPAKRFELSYWLIAAGIIGLILVGTLFLYTGKTVSPAINYETVSLDFGDQDYTDVASKINILHEAYVKLDLK